MNTIIIKQQPTARFLDSLLKLHYKVLLRQG